jgi:hypothetical protein
MPLSIKIIFLIKIKKKKKSFIIEYISLKAIIITEKNTFLFEIIFFKIFN